MTDEGAPYGLGSLDSPPDDRDWDISLAYATAGIDPVASPPSSFRSPTPYPPVYNQNTTPQCVSYSSGSSKVYQDLRDQGLFSPDHDLFFRQIGGNQNGAVPRAALQQMLDHGYPPVGNAPGAQLHRITAYYSVPVSRSAIQSAIMSFGPVLISTRWFYSWFRPVNGVLPAPDSIAGGHEILCDGWTPKGLELVNSWGPAWGDGGRCILPWAYLSSVREVWKSVDQVVAKPRVYTMHFAPHARVMHYDLTPGGLLTDSTVTIWGPRESTAGCSAPKVKRGTNRGQATVAYVPRGTFRKRWVKLGGGVTVSYR